MWQKHSLIPTLAQLLECCLCAARSILWFYCTLACSPKPQFFLSALHQMGGVWQECLTFTPLREVAVAAPSSTTAFEVPDPNLKVDGHGLSQGADYSDYGANEEVRSLFWIQAARVVASWELCTIACDWFGGLPYVDVQRLTACPGWC